MSEHNPHSDSTCTPGAPVRILIGDDHQILLDMLGVLLQPEFSIVGTASDGAELVTEFRRLHPDIVIVDVTMPECNGIEAARRIWSLDPEARLIFLTMQDDPALAAEAFAIGAAAYLVKVAPASELLNAVRIVAEGGQYLSPSIAGGDIDALVRLQQGDPLAQISAREREVLGLLVSGLPMKSVARTLGITARTVAFHKYKAMETLGLKDNAQLMEFALRYGLLGNRRP